MFTAVIVVKGELQANALFVPVRANIHKSINDKAFFMFNALR